MIRGRALLLTATAAFAALGVGYAVSQEEPPRDARPAASAPAAATPPAGAVQEQPPSAGTEEAPPSTDAPLAAPNDPAAAAEEDRLTAQAEEEASRSPAAAPTRRRSQSASASGADVAAATGDQTAAPIPVLPRQRLAVAVIQGLDKTTARTLRFYAPVNQSVRYEGLVVTARACEATNPDEVRQDSYAYLEIFSQPRPSPGRPNTAPRQVYRGWMSAQAPTVHPFGHPAYDLWLIECRASAPVREGGA